MKATTDQVAIPHYSLIKTPVDAVIAAITSYVGTTHGVAAINNRLPDPEEEAFIDTATALIKVGDEKFANEIANVSHELEDEGGTPNLFMVAFSMAAEAGVFWRKGDETMAWRRASYAAMLLGIVSGSGIKGKKLNLLIQKSGGDAKAAKYSPLIKFALELREKGGLTKFSANHAAGVVKDDVVAKSRALGVNMSVDRAQATIAKWFRDADGAGSAN